MDGPDASCLAGDDRRLAGEIDRIAGALDQVLAAPDAHAALEVLLRYLGATHTRMPATQVQKLLMKAVSPHGKEAIVTFLDEIELRGERKGERKGQRRGQRKALEQLLLKLLAIRFGVVPEAAKARIGAATNATLEAWALRVLTAPTLEAVLEQQAAPPSPPRRTASRKRASPS